MHSNLEFTIQESGRVNFFIIISFHLNRTVLLYYLVIIIFIFLYITWFHCNGCWLRVLARCSEIIEERSRSMLARWRANRDALSGSDPSRKRYTKHTPSANRSSTRRLFISVSSPTICDSEFTWRLYNKNIFYQVQVIHYSAIKWLKLIFWLLSLLSDFSTD